MSSHGLDSKVCAIVSVHRIGNEYLSHYFIRSKLKCEADPLVDLCWRQKSSFGVERSKGEKEKWESQHEYQKVTIRIACFAYDVVRPTSTHTETKAHWNISISPW